MLKTKILIIRFSSIGDIVLTSPIVRCIKQQVEDVEIHFLTKRRYIDLLKSNPYIEKLHLFDSSLLEVTPDLKIEKFDYIVDLHNNIRSSVIKSAIKAKSFSFKKSNLHKWLLIQFKINRISNDHIVDRMFRAIAPLGVRNDNKGLDFFIAEEDEYNFSKLPEDFKEGYVAVALAASFYTKRLPAKKHLEYLSLSDVPFILVGGKDESEIAEEIEKSSNPKVLNLCNKLTIKESASIVKKAKLVITNDTGLMHIAAAYKKKILSIWGSTVPEFGMYPYQTDQSSKILQVKGLHCQPCSKIGRHKCPKQHFKCMNQQDATVISDWIKANYNKP